MDKNQISLKVLEEENKYLKEIIAKTNEKKFLKILKRKDENIETKKNKSRNLKVALVVDVDNWAFYNIAKNFKDNCKKIDITIICMSHIDGDIFKMWQLFKEFDAIHFFCRGLTISNLNEEIYNKKKLYGDRFNIFEKNYVEGKSLTTCVYDHLFLKEDLDFTKYLFSKIKNYYVCSNILMEIYKKLEITYKPSTVITDGINLEMFYPINISRFDSVKDRKIKIGWVGNSKWVDNQVDHKGINTIIKPAVENLIKKGYNVELFTADKYNKHIPINEMKNFYSEIDLYVCASISEGTPNPVLESMACGIPVISTNVGIVNDAFGKNQKEFILKERSVEELTNKIEKIIKNPSLFKKLSKENLESIKHWQWKYKAQQFEKFIIESYKNKE